MSKKLKFKSATTIQKFMRGYKVKQRYHMIVFEGRVLRDIDKFSGNNKQVMWTCANLISLAWRIYKRIKAKK
jgi:glutamine amidotransferase PdxT